MTRVGRAVHGATAAGRLLSPPPWALDREPYAALASALPFARADRALDIGCGTGRSLVGLAPSVPESCRVLGLDVFDDHIILGNGPAFPSATSRSNALNDCIA
jgi:SAM-dependent methyltransferase